MNPRHRWTETPLPACRQTASSGSRATAQTRGSTGRATPGLPSSSCPRPGSPTGHHQDVRISTRRHTPPSDSRRQRRYRPPPGHRRHPAAPADASCPLDRSTRRSSLSWCRGTGERAAPEPPQVNAHPHRPGRCCSTMFVERSARAKERPARRAERSTARVGKNCPCHEENYAIAIPSPKDSEKHSTNIEVRIRA